MRALTRQVNFCFRKKRRKIDDLSVAMSGRLVQKLFVMNINMAHESHSIAKEQHHIKLVVAKFWAANSTELEYTLEVNMNNWPKYHHTISMTRNSYMTDVWIWKAIVCWSLAADIVFGFPMPAPQYRTSAQSTLLNGGWWAHWILFSPICVFADRIYNVTCQSFDQRSILTIEFVRITYWDSVVFRSGCMCRVQQEDDGQRKWYRRNFTAHIICNARAAHRPKCEQQNYVHPVESLNCFSSWSAFQQIYAPFASAGTHIMQAYLKIIKMTLRMRPNESRSNAVHLIQSQRCILSDVKYW